MLVECIFPDKIACKKSSKLDNFRDFTGIFSKYAYAFPKNSGSKQQLNIVFLEFTVIKPNCLPNENEPKTAFSNKFVVENLKLVGSLKQHCTKLEMIPPKHEFLATKKETSIGYSSVSSQFNSVKLAQTLTGFKTLPALILYPALFRYYTSATFLFLVLLLSQTSCVEYKNIVYLRNAPDSLVVRELPIPPYPAHQIQVDDQLSITITSIDPMAAAPLNINSGETKGTDNSAVGAGYLVDRNGNIDLPLLGTQLVKNLTVQQLKDSISLKASKYIKDPIVNIRFLNFRFTILGEVASPGIFVVPYEKITLFEALGMAGDISSYGNRENILIVREQDGKEIFQTLNLHSQDIFKSDFFYLRKNDLIIIEPLKQKTASIQDPASKVLPYVSVLVTLATLIITLTR